MKPIISILLFSIFIFYQCANFHLNEENDPTSTSTFSVPPEANFVQYHVGSTREFEKWYIQDEYASPRALTTNLCAEIFTRYKDQFDFLLLILGRVTTPDTLSFVGLALGGGQYEQGLGRITRGQGCPGSTTEMNLLHYFLITSTNTGAILHEIAHRWGNYMIDSTEAHSATGAHWGYVGSDIRGTLGGFQESTIMGPTDNEATGSFTVDSFSSNTNSNGAYSQLELYLMGMIPSTEVSNFSVFRDVTNRRTNMGTISFTATRFNYTRDNFVELLNGGVARVPNSSTSKKNFTLLPVVITDRNLTSFEIPDIKNMINRITRNADDGDANFYNFYEATRRLGQLTVPDLNQAIK